METSLPKYFTALENIKIPSIGLGTYDMTDETICDVVYNSIKSGTRLIDTAAVYGSEHGIGLGIKKAISEKIVKREDLFITTKLAKGDRKDPESSLRKSLERLDLEYIDLYLDHWPKYFDYNEKGEKINLMPQHKLWGIMESLVEKKLTKNIGVSNYNVQSLCNLLSYCKIKPAVLEIELHPYLNQKNLTAFCKREGILIFAYNPLVKGCYCKAYKDQTNIDLLGEPVIQELSKKYNKTPGQIVLNWIVEQGHIPIPMTNNPKRMIENLGSLEFKLSKEDLQKIDSLNKMFRFGTSTMWNIYAKDVDVFA